MAETYSVVRNLTDVSFHPAESDDYGLAMILSDTELSFCIADLSRSRYISFQQIVRNDKELPAEKRLTGFPDFFSEVMDHLPYLKRNFKIFRAAFMTEMQTLIPGPVYEPASNEHYLSLMYGSQSGSQILSDHVEVMDAHQVFSVPLTIAGAIDRHLDRRRLFSFGTVLIQSIWTNYHRTGSLRVFLNIRHAFLDIVIFNGKQISFYNTFRQHCPEDILYFLIFVMEQLNLNPEQVTVVLLGETGEDDHLAELFHTYLRHVEYGKRSSFFKFSPVLNELQPHARYALFNFLSCGL